MEWRLEHVRASWLLRPRAVGSALRTGQPTAATSRAPARTDPAIDATPFDATSPTCSSGNGRSAIWRTFAGPKSASRGHFYETRRALRDELQRRGPDHDRIPISPLRFDGDRPGVQVRTSGRRHARRTVRRRSRKGILVPPPLRRSLLRHAGIPPRGRAGHCRSTSPNLARRKTPPSSSRSARAIQMATLIHAGRERPDRSQL